MDDKAYFRVRDAANSQVSNDSRDTWAVMDSVLACVPHLGNGGRPKAETDPVDGVGFRDEQLQELAARLEADSVVTTRGEPYTWQGLKHLREGALAWPPQTRFAEASARTHIEVGSPNTEGGKVLAALCKVARGETVRRPAGLDPDAWSLAVQKIGTATGGRARTKWMVSLNTWRIAMGRRTNIPTSAPPTERPTKEVVRQVLQMVKDDPEVQEVAIEEATQDRMLGATLGATASKADRRYQDRWHRRNGMGPGTSHARMGRMLDVNKGMQLAERGLTMVIEALREIIPLSEGEGEEVDLYIENRERQLMVLKELRRSKGIDQDLQDLLDGDNGSTT